VVGRPPQWWSASHYGGPGVVALSPQAFGGVVQATPSSRRGWLATPDGLHGHPRWASGMPAATLGGHSGGGLRFNDPPIYFILFFFLV
jgi:hypothetical protein